MTTFRALDLPDQLRGDTWNFTLVFRDSQGTPIDITGNQYTFSLRDEPDNDLDENDDDVVLQQGPFIADPGEGINGILRFTIQPTVTEDLVAPFNYYYDVQELTSSSVVTTLLLGRCKVLRDVTRTATYIGTPTVELQSSSGVTLYSGISNSTAPTDIFLDGINGVYQQIKEDSVLSFSALVVGKDRTTRESCAFKFEGAVERDAGTAQIIGTIGKTILGKENPDFDAYVEVPVATNNYAIKVVNANANVTDWSARIIFTEVYT